MQQTILFFDIESTGLETSKDRIIELSLIKTDFSFTIIDKKKLRLSNCGIQIQRDAFNAHGISELDLISCHPFSSYASKILSFIDSCDFIAGFNIKGFDIQMLYEEFSRAELVWNPKPIIDPGIIFKNKEKRTLGAALKFYCGKDIEGAHDAENDVLATIEVLKGQIEKYSFDDFYIKTEKGAEKCSLTDILISESKYDNEDNRLSWDGKIILGEDGKVKWNFGKFKGLDLNEADLGYINWFLTSDFPSQTKNVLRSLLNKKKDD